MALLGRMEQFRLFDVGMLSLGNESLVRQAPQELDLLTHGVHQYLFELVAKYELHFFNEFAPVRGIFGCFGSIV